MSDRYEHLFIGHSPETFDNLLTLARHLVFNAPAIDAAGGLSFEGGIMFDPLPAPQDAATADLPLPPLAFGPRAGIAPGPGEEWEDYCGRAFGIRLFPADPFCHWLQSPLWRRTEPSAKGAGLRIAYMLDHGVPHDHVEIAMGEAWTDYDRSGFLWDLLAPPRDLIRRGDDRPIRDWPDFVGTVECARRRASVLLGPDTLVRALVATVRAQAADIAGLEADALRHLSLALGPLPQSLVDLLAVAGGGAGPLSEREYLAVGADRIVGLNRMGRAIAALWHDKPERAPVPDRAVFVGRDSTTGLYFVLPGILPEQPREDSPVFRLHIGTGGVTRVADGLWGWVQAGLRTHTRNGA